MTSDTAETELLRAFEQAGLSPETLDPWEAWKVFKSFLHRELKGGYDSAGFQIAKHTADGSESSMYFVRQLSERDEDGDDQPFWSIMVEFRYNRPSFEPVAEVDVWALDYRSLEEFASVVEGMPAFQAAIAGRPRYTEVSSGEE